MTIVVIDDSASALMVLEHLASHKDESVIGFSSAMDAEAYLEEHRASIIVMDCSMPYLQGIEFISIVRNGCLNSTTPILMVTQLSDIATRKKALRAGATEFMVKPIKPKEFKAAIRRLMHASELARV